MTATGEVLAYGDPLSATGGHCSAPLRMSAFLAGHHSPVPHGDDVDAVTWENLGEEVKLYLFDREGTE